MSCLRCVWPPLFDFLFYCPCLDLHHLLTCHGLPCSLPASNSPLLSLFHPVSSSIRPPLCVNPIKSSLSPSEGSPGPCPTRQGSPNFPASLLISPCQHWHSGPEARKLSPGFSPCPHFFFLYQKNLSHQDGVAKGATPTDPSGISLNTTSSLPFV